MIAKKIAKILTDEETMLGADFANKLLIPQKIFFNDFSSLGFCKKQTITYFISLS